jgi:STE24 endopeptidase
MNPYLIVILAFILISFSLNLIVERLNLKYIQTNLPKEFKDCYDAEKYKKAQMYLRETTGFSLLTDTLTTTVTVIFILLGGFNLCDTAARSFGLGSILTGLIYLGLLLTASGALSLPFSAYSTFVIEAKYGFNTTTVKTFFGDILKICLLTVLLGGPLLCLVLWFFEQTGALAWLYCWGALCVFQLFLLFAAPVIIMPLFNKFTPMPEGALKDAISSYARTQKFKIKGVFTMDGSKRSSKSNAFFSGIGRFRRVVLFDTLIEKHSLPELLAIVAHEIGHYKKRHILKHLCMSLTISALMFAILSVFMENPHLFAAFKMEHVSIYASLVFFGFLYTPLDMLLSIVGNALSRRNEYEADRFAADTTGMPESMISALKKLSIDNLSNLTPHPLKVMLSYSHPPVLARIQALRQHDRDNQSDPANAACTPKLFEI